MSENRDLLSRIGQLAGQINLHKNQDHVEQKDTFKETRARSRPLKSQTYDFAYSGSPHVSSTLARGRVGKTTSYAHRNRTLVLNNASAGNMNTEGPQKTTTTGDSGFAGSLDDGVNKSSHGTNWVSKRDRHMQLINSSIFDKEVGARSKAIEYTRRQKALERDQREKQKLKNHLQLLITTTEPSSHITSTNTQQSIYELNISGLRFQVFDGGSKLRRVPSRCSKGPLCRYTHDPKTVAVCPTYLQSGNCPNGEGCDLSHEPTPERVPTCLHFLRGRCSKPGCRYAHVRVNPSALVCKAFSSLGFCSKGYSCSERHVHECPDWSNTGVCRNKRCRLPHVDRAGQIRKHFATNNTEFQKAESDNSTAQMNDSDLSSNEEEHLEIESDDVDSDGLDEDVPLQPQNSDSGIFHEQDDYVYF